MAWQIIVLEIITAQLKNIIQPAEAEQIKPGPAKCKGCPHCFIGPRFLRYLQFFERAAKGK